MPDVLTFLLIELGPRDGAPAGDDVVGDPEHGTITEAVGAGGGAVVALPAPTHQEGRHVVAAVFQLAGDAARAAVDISRRPTPSSLRMALCTGEAHAEGATLGGPALGRGTELLRYAGPHQVLVTASSAVMASPTLPRGVELLDLGARALGEGHPPERIYELRMPRAIGVGPHADDVTASNLDWARRAVHGVVLGRDEPMAALESAWKATLGGDRRMVVLAGDGGIGKTTLAAELALRLHAEGALVLYGRWDQGSLAPYQAVREALGTYANRCPTPLLRRDLEGCSDEIARLLPDVGARVGGVRPPLLGDPDGERLRLFEAIEAWLNLLAQRRPLLLVLDDLHWAGRSSHLLVDHLRLHGGTAPVMLLLTAREGEATGGEAPRSVERALRDAVPVERIELQGLDPPAVVRLMEQAIGRPLGPADDDLVEWLTRDTAGNPLFVQEVLRGVVASPDGRAALRDARQRLPERLADIVDWRLSQLPARTAEVLADAALVGHSFELDLLAETTGTPAVSLRAPLDVAVQAGLLRAQPSDDHDFVFAHEVVRRTLRDRLDSPRAAELHRRIAAALTSRALDGRDVSSVEVADHHLRGADASTARQAVRWARNAAEAARRETAFESAVQLLTRAVDVHDRLGQERWTPRLVRDPDTTPAEGTPAADDTADATGEQHDSHTTLACELRLELAEAHDRAGEYRARDERHLEAAALARDLGRTDLFTRAAMGLRGRLPASPPPDHTARGLLEEALARMPDDDSRGRALVLARLAHVRHFDASYRDRRKLSDQAIAMARRLEAPVVLANVLVARCLALVGPDDADDDLAIGEEIVRIGERTGDPDLMLQGMRVHVTALMMLGRHQEARAEATRFLNLSEQVRHPDHLRIATMWEIVRLTLVGHYEQAEALVRRLRDQLVAAGHPQSRSIHLLQTFPMLWLRGGVGGSDRVVDPTPTPELTPTSSWAMATWFETVAGDPSRADTRLAGQDPVAYLGTVRRDYMWWPTMVVLALTASRGHPTWATALYEVLSRHQGRYCMFGYTAFAGAVDHHLGTLAVTAGRLDDGIQHLEAGLERHRDLGAAPFVALSTRWLAHALVLQGDPQDRERADSLQAESVTLAEELDLHGLPDLHNNQPN